MAVVLEKNVVCPKCGSPDVECTWYDEHGECVEYWCVDCGYTWKEE